MGRPMDDSRVCVVTHDEKRVSVLQLVNPHVGLACDVGDMLVVRWHRDRFVLEVACQHNSARSPMGWVHGLARLTQSLCLTPNKCCACLYVPVHVYMCVPVHAHTCTHARMHVSVVCPSTCLPACMDGWMDACMCMHVHACACMCACVYDMHACISYIRTFSSSWVNECWSCVPLSHIFNRTCA